MLYTDVLTTVIMTVWLSTDSRGVDPHPMMATTKWLTGKSPHIHWPTVQVGYTLITQPPIQRLEDCQLTVTVCLSVCPQELSISYGEHLLADKRYEEAGLGIIKQCLFVLCVQEYLDPSEIFVLFLKLMFFLLLLFSIYPLWSPRTSVVLIPEERKLETSVLYGFSSALHRRRSNFIG